MKESFTKKEPDPIDDTMASYPLKDLFNLIDRGRRVAEKLAEIERILSERDKSRSEILKEDLNSAKKRG